jgi:hypothetical protein
MTFGQGRRHQPSARPGVGRSRYGKRVTALCSWDEQSHTGDLLLSGAAPAAISEMLLELDRIRFDAAHRPSLGAAYRGEVLRCSQRWCRAALLQRDARRFASTVRRFASTVRRFASTVRRFASTVRRGAELLTVGTERIRAASGTSRWLLG